MKKILALLLSCCMLFTLVGCSTNQKGLMDAMKKMGKWDAYEVNQTGTMAMSMMGEDVKIDINSTGYMNMKDMKGNITLEMKEASGMMKLPEMNMYIDGGNSYINKGYFTDTYTTNGLPMPRKLRELTADYICIDAGSNEMMTQMMAIMAKGDYVQQVYSLYEDLFKVTKVDIPVEKSGDTYKMHIDGEKIIQVVESVMNNLPEALALINEKLELGLGKEDLDSITADKEELTPLMSTMMPMIKEALAQSSIDFAFTLKGDTYTEDLSMKFNLMEGIKLQMDMKVTGKKVEARNVELPTNIVKLNMEEYMELLAPQTVTVDLETGSAFTSLGNMLILDVKVANGVTYLPVKEIITHLGYEIDYDTKTKTVSYISGEQNIPLKVELIGESSYITLEELEALGFTVILNDTFLTLID